MLVETPQSIAQNMQIRMRTHARPALRFATVAMLHTPLVHVVLALIGDIVMHRHAGRRVMVFRVAYHAETFCHDEDFVAGDIERRKRAADNSLRFAI